MAAKRNDRPSEPLAWRYWAAGLLAFAVTLALREGPLRGATAGQLTAVACVLAFCLAMALVRL